MPRRFMCSIGVLAIVLPLASDVGATVLPFDEQDGGQARVARGYGSRVAQANQDGFTYGAGSGFTPNVVVEHRTIGPGGDRSLQMNAYLGWGLGGYGDLAGAAYPYNAAGTGEISFIPDDGWGITINSFEVAAWDGGGFDPSATLKLVDGDYSVLLDLGPLVFPRQGRLRVSPRLTHTGTVRLLFGDSWYIAIDNLDFNQVPEPASLGLGLLVGGGLAALAGRRRPCDGVGRCANHDA